MKQFPFPSPPDLHASRHTQPLQTQPHVPSFWCSPQQQHLGRRPAQGSPLGPPATSRRAPILPKRTSSVCHNTGSISSSATGKAPNAHHFQILEDFHRLNVTHTPVTRLIPSQVSFSCSKTQSHKNSRVSMKVFFNRARKKKNADSRENKDQGLLTRDGMHLSHLCQIRGQRMQFPLSTLSEIAEPFYLKLPKEILSSANTQPGKCQPTFKPSKCIST